MSLLKSIGTFQDLAQKYWNTMGKEKSNRAVVALHACMHTQACVETRVGRKARSMLEHLKLILSLAYFGVIGI